jgi:glycosidase
VFVQALFLKYADASNMLVFLENHDTQRFNQIYPSINDYRLGLTLIATVRGIPQIYYGSEIGMKGEKNKGDADIRRDFPGGWEGDTKNAFTGQAINNEEKYYLDFTKKLFKTSSRLRSNSLLRNLFSGFAIWEVLRNAYALVVVSLVEK